MLWYVNAFTGNDTNNGMSPNTAWQTIAGIKWNLVNLGDTVEITGNYSITSANSLNANNTGTPIPIQTYNLLPSISYTSLAQIQQSILSGNIQTGIYKIGNLTITVNAASTPITAYGTGFYPSLAALQTDSLSGNLPQGLYQVGGAVYTWDGITLKQVQQYNGIFNLNKSNYLNLANDIRKVAAGQTVANSESRARIVFLGDSITQGQSPDLGKVNGWQVSFINQAAKLLTKSLVKTSVESHHGLDANYNGSGIPFIFQNSDTRILNIPTSSTGNTQANYIPAGGWNNFDFAAYTGGIISSQGAGNVIVFTPSTPTNSLDVLYIKGPSFDNFKVKLGSNTTITAGAVTGTAFTSGNKYIINTVGTVNWTSIGVPASYAVQGYEFTANSTAPTGTGSCIAVGTALSGAANMTGASVPWLSTFTTGAAATNNIYIIESQSSNYLLIMGFEAYDSATPELGFINVGQGGTVLGNYPGNLPGYDGWITNTPAQTWEALNPLVNTGCPIAPQCVFIEFSINEWVQQGLDSVHYTPAAFAAYLTKAVTTLLNVAPNYNAGNTAVNVVLVSSPPSPYAGTFYISAAQVYAAAAPYTAAVRQVALTYGVAVIDIWNIFGGDNPASATLYGNDIAIANGWMTTGDNHPESWAYNIPGQMLANFFTSILAP